MIDISGCQKAENIGARAWKERAALRPFFTTDEGFVLHALQDHDLLRWLAALPIPIDQYAGQKYMRFLGDPDVCARVLCVDERPLGLVSLGTELSFWIKREFRGEGLGLWAVRRFLDELPATTKSVTACCMQDNKTAAALLLRLGFENPDKPFRRFSFAHGHAVDFLRYQLCLIKANAGPKT
ncbi:GNAT family N-acetyltransferase [Ruegeria hyattellae]|uniref:GNAT family N-acetyltransferase n=1 Tax=Ruegeria hyattellae TaxID=3233337 RepID=UPI00355B12F4